MSVSAAPDASLPPRQVVAGWLRRKSAAVLFGTGVVLAVLSLVLLGSERADWAPFWLKQSVFALDILFVLLLAGLIFLRVRALLLARRERSMGTQLHMRLAGVFAVAALVPTLVLALFASLTLDVWLESLFSDRIGSVLRNSLITAQAYEQEHKAELRSDVIAMATDLNRLARQGGDGAQLNDLVTQQALVRNMHRAYVFNIDKAIIARGEFSYLFNFVPPTEEQLDAARSSGDVVLIPDADGDEFRALVFLAGFADSFLYVSRHVQGDVLRLLGETSQTVEFYDNLETHRSSLLYEWALWYLGIALVVVLVAIMLGLWFAERLAKPVGRLAGAAEKVGAGDLDVRVKEERGSDEIAMLSRVFNRMTGQLKGQRDALIHARDDTERRRLFIEAVLSGVTAGVIGLDADGRIDLMNEAAAEMLGMGLDECQGAVLGRVSPGLDGLYSTALTAPGGVARGEFRQMVRGQDREFLARVGLKSPDDPDEGYVVTFDDMTALASAQRVAAWGDVARRIAHEIKNPLTPIQLSADRLRRKYTEKLGEEGESFGNYLDVITRQAGDIRRMVDEFSKFARMPEPKVEEQDLSALVRDAVLLQREARGDIDYPVWLPDEPVDLALDRGLIGQVLTNLLQNAADAIDARCEREGEAMPAPVIAVRLEEGPRNWRLSIMDNGIGLPQDGRERLTDPYVTNRVKGTGLGLAIVKKIIEQHGGVLQLDDAADDGRAPVLDGARATVRLPKPAGRAQTQSTQQSAGQGSGTKDRETV